MDGDLKLNALYTIFEKHLYDFADEADTEAEFIDKIVNDYIKFLVSNNVAVPRRWHTQIVEELRDQIRKMLVKKTYGCLSLEEFMVGQKPTERQARRRDAKRKYSKLF